ncbi:ThuA domain-containing protein [Pedobacter sp. SD-b]|uniref:ThuA domain-containing protein n=1 Tax=Pedobacter segetis TaxID=2793069 RepID=A0ABS1BM30_9SPHI|nr:ThuA domain-containing protein [Pedobacter segetis]MBK0383911.1 ThuA domain-containing protein [Pedobacter segetis]
MKIKNHCLYVLFLFCLISTQSWAQAKKQFNALLITKTAGWHHESINDGVSAIKALGEKNFFNVTWNQDGVPITEKYLQNFQVVIFLNTTGDIFNADEQKAIEKFIQSGKGYVGIHSASDTEYDWAWYTKLVGRMFHIHPAIQTAKLRLTKNTFTGLNGFTDGQLWTDEWYEFGPEQVKDLNYILAVDETSYNSKVEWPDRNLKGVGMGNFHPIAWYHEFDGGRAFYTALGHQPTDYTNTAFLDHIYAGIFWAATGKK